MATIHSVLLWFQDRELKKKQKRRIWVNLLPPFQVMESVLFDLIITGFGLLTAALLFGFLQLITSLLNILLIKPLLVLFHGFYMVRF